ncbi:MAG: hypothetical protein SF052_10170 [Bacteroidia bacterium]|nr:hypothetical protein [Bacteroidia bacterium]
MSKSEIVINKHAISWTNAQVRIEFQSAFIALLKAPSNPSSLFDVGKHFSFADSIPKKAFVLITKSIFGACKDLIIESRSAKGVPIDGGNLSVLGKKMNNFFDSKVEAEFTLGPELIKNPRSLPIIDEAKEFFFECLKELEFNYEEQSSLSNRLKTYTVFNLHEEWRQYSAYYSQVKSELFSEYSDAVEKELQWIRYYDFLKKETEKSVFGESFSLSDIYIQLRACYQTRTSDAPNKKIVIDLTRHLDSWLESANANDTIRVISGGPGSGKSAFSKIYASYCAEKGEIRVLHIPMHYLTLKDDITDLVGRFAKERGLKENPFELNEKVMVIFDGLDELSMQGRLAEEIARNFIDLVTKEINLKNTRSGPKLFVLITGRDLAVQSGETYLRKEGQILYLLPYLAYLAKEFDDPEELLNVDQRNLWWKKFGQLKGYGYVGLPQELQSPDLKEITAQPLLNYLVALSYTHKTYDFTGSISLNEIYANLIESVYNRGYEESGRTTPIHKSLEHREGLFSLPEFEKVLEEIAIATWQGNGRTTTVNAIEQRFKESGMKKVLESFQRNAESGVTNLLAAFYFRKSEEISGTEKTFEFTHKSFSEYLTARRIVKIFVNYIHEELERKKQDSDRGIDISEALEKWAKLTGPAKIDTYIRDFLLREMKLWSKKPEVNMDSLQNSLIEMINEVVKNNFPLEKIAGLTFQQSVRHFQNATEALFVLHFSVASITAKRSKIDWQDSISAGSLINSMSPQREYF